LSFTDIRSPWACAGAGAKPNVATTAAKPAETRIFPRIFTVLAASTRTCGIPFPTTFRHLPWITGILYKSRRFHDIGRGKVGHGKRTARQGIVAGGPPPRGERLLRDRSSRQLSRDHGRLSDCGRLLVWRLVRWLAQTSGSTRNPRSKGRRSRR